MTTTGLFVGRFQPFHNGHYNAIQEALTHVDDLIIAIGSSQRYDELPNPFTVEERIQMICCSIQDIEDKIYLTTIPDYHNYEEWISHVEELEADVIITGSELVKSLADGKGIRVIWIDRPDGISATLIRDKLSKCEPIEHLVPYGTLMVLGEIGAYEKLKKLKENQLPMYKEDEK